MAQGVRRRLEQITTDDDFDAFLIDEYRDVRAILPSNASRSRRINLLLERVEATEVDIKLTAWLAGRSTPARAPSLIRHKFSVWSALAGAAALALVLLTVALVVLLGRSQPSAQVVVVPLEQLTRQLAANGLTRDHLDSPEQFAAKVQTAGPDNLRYEVSVDRDRETQELRRLVIALRVQNDQLVAVTQYLLQQVKQWKHSAAPQLQMLAQLTRGIEAAIDLNVVVDMSAPIRHDTLPTKEKLTALVRSGDLSEEIVDMTVQFENSRQPSSEDKMFKSNTLNPIVPPPQREPSPLKQTGEKNVASVLVATPTSNLESKNGELRDPFRMKVSPSATESDGGLKWPFAPLLSAQSKTVESEKSSGLKSPFTSNLRPKEIQEKLTKEQIESGFKKVDILVCKDEGALGIYNIQLTIGKTGRIINAKMISGSHAKDCIMAAVKQARFLEFTGDPITLIYPFIVP